jgi:hypothetical protein
MKIAGIFWGPNEERIAKIRAQLSRQWQLGANCLFLAMRAPYALKNEKPTIQT